MVSVVLMFPNYRNSKIVNVVLFEWLWITCGDEACGLLCYKQPDSIGTWIRDLKLRILDL